MLIYTAFACRAADISISVFFIPASDSPLLAIKECLCIQHDTLGSPFIRNDDCIQSKQKKSDHCAILLRRKL